MPDLLFGSWVEHFDCNVSILSRKANKLWERGLTVFPVVRTTLWLCHQLLAFKWWLFKQEKTLKDLS